MLLYKVVAAGDDGWWMVHAATETLTAYFVCNVVAIFDIF